MIAPFLIDTVGATAPEFISAALSRHPSVSVLPGLAFVRDDLRLYRPHNLTGLDGADVFDRLWAPSFEPTGRMWAGLARTLSREAQRGLDPSTARAAFASRWSPKWSYAQTLFHFAADVAPLFDAWKPAATHLGFCGAPFLRTVDWSDLIENRVIVFSAELTLPTWLALISFRSIVNCVDALTTWIIHGLVVAAARDSGVRVLSIDAIAVAESGCIKPALDALGIDPSGPLLLAPGYGHLVFDEGVFSRTRDLATQIEEILAGDPLYEFASRVAEWAPSVIRSEDVRHLIALYIRHWRTTAHVHFDSIGPLEREIVEVSRGLAREFDPKDRRSFEQRFSQNFFFEQIQFRSYSFENPAILVDTYLGALEELVTIPASPYFVHATLCYLERGLDRQKKWFDSFMPIAESALYTCISRESFRGLIDAHGFRSRLKALESEDRKVREKARQRAIGEVGGDDGAKGS